MTKEELKGKIAFLFKNAREEGAITKWADGLTEAEKVLALIKEAGYKSLVDIEKQIWKSYYILPDNKQKVINGIKQVGGG